MDVLLLSTDLMLVAQVGGAVRATGRKLHAAATLEGETEGAAADALVLVDLALPGLAIEAVMARLRGAQQPPRAIVAFAQHVHAARLQAATAAGCDEVLSRGQFTARIGEIVARYAGQG